ncbi:unnamed protein product [Caretta caretta]
MRGRKVNAEIEQQTCAPPDGLKHGWEAARLPPVPDHQARVLDPVDPGEGGCRIDGLASLHPRAKSPRSWTMRSTSSAYTDRTSCSSGSRSTNPINLLRRRQRKGSIIRAYSWPLPYSSPKADRFGQGPVEPDQTLCGGIQHLEKTHKLGSEAKHSQSAQEILLVHPV